jgi:hypothetical protein
MRIDEIIRKTDSGYVLYSKSKGKDGERKRLGGPYQSRAGAEKREREVQYFKHANEGNKAQKGIPANATLSQLDKIRSTTTDPEKRKRAHWLANMRRGSKKK